MNRNLKRYVKEMVKPYFLATFHYLSLRQSVSTMLIVAFMTHAIYDQARKESI